MPFDTRAVSSYLLIISFVLIYFSIVTVNNCAISVAFAVRSGGLYAKSAWFKGWLYVSGFKGSQAFRQLKIWKLVCFSFCVFCWTFTR